MGFPKQDAQLRDEYLVLMTKWEFFKREGSKPPPPEYLIDRARMAVIASLRDKLREAEAIKYARQTKQEE